jgi:ribosomal protein S18 acetylase RimI-like enzyme
LKISIRSYHDEDQPDVIRLWEKVFPGAPPHNNPARDLRTRREAQSELFLVALYGEKLIGTVMAGCEEGQGWVYYLGVDPDYRRQGIATSLMKRIEARMIGFGCSELHLQIFNNQPEVQAFYESLGYFAEDRRSMGKWL